jgi:hypothetical protein
MPWGCVNSGAWMLCPETRKYSDESMTIEKEGQHEHRNTRRRECWANCRF